MKKVLMIASEASHFRNFHIPYIKYLLENNVQVFTASRGSFSFEGAVHIKLPYKKKMFSLGNIGVILKLSSIIRKNGFDIVCTNSTLAGFTGRMALILSGKRKAKAIHICHGYLFDDDKSRRSKSYLLFEKSVKSRTDILAVMNCDDLKIAEKYSLGKKIVFINGMGLVPQKFPFIKETLIQSFKKSNGIGENDYIFLCVGEFSERKHQKTVIEACSLISSKDYKVIFAGEGNLLGECRELAKEKNLQKNTIFLGHCSDVNLLYRSSSCLISSSRYEGLPFNVMEGLFCGEKIIVTDVKGNRDLAEEHGGAVYPYSDPKALAEIMERLITDARDPKSKEGSRESCLDPKYLLDNVFDENIRSLELIP